MNFKIIVQIVGQPDPKGIRHHLLQRYGIDFTALIELTLSYWEFMESGDDEMLQAALEHHLVFHNRRISRYLDRGRIDFEEYLQLIRLLAASIQQMFEHLHPILTPYVVARMRGGEVDYRLDRHIGTDAAAVIEIKLRPK